MSDVVQFTIPGRPKAWERPVEIPDPRRVGKRIRINPKKMREYQKAVGHLANAAMRGHQRFTGAIKLEVLCVYEVPASWPAAKRELALAGRVWKTSVPDLDNLEKLIADALNGIVYLDDNQIAKKSSGKRYGTPERTEVRIQGLDVLDNRSAPGSFREAAAELAGQDSLPILPRPLV